MNLHELVNLPHGEATKKIKAAGKWDEWAGLQEREFEVKINIEYRDYETKKVKVYARSEDEACNKAEHNEMLDDDVIEAEAIEAKEV